MAPLNDHFFAKERALPDFSNLPRDRLPKSHPVQTRLSVLVFQADQVNQEQVMKARSLHNRGRCSQEGNWIKKASVKIKERCENEMWCHLYCLVILLVFVTVMFV